MASELCESLMYILLIEDQIIIANFISQELVETGYTVDVARDSRAGLECALATDYDTIVLGRILPLMDGLQLLSELRRRDCRTPVLLLISSDKHDEGVEEIDGANDTLVKPFTISELADHIQTLVRRAPLRANLVLPPVDHGPQSQGAHHQAVQKFQSLLELTPYATIIVNSLGRIVLANWQTEQLFGYGRDEIIGRSIEILIPKHFGDQHIGHRTQFFANPRVRPMDGRHELRGLHRNGREFPVEVSLNPLVGDEGVLVSTTIRDITRRKHEEEKLRELSARLLNMREEERTRISRTIHDELGQVLTALKMDLAWMDRRLGQDQAPLLDKTKAMAELIDTTVQTLRRIATELRPAVLDDLGLPAAIEWQLQECQRRTSIVCTLANPLEELVIDDAVTTTLFRIFQEALTNVARHAQASRIEVCVEETSDSLILCVEDNGRGITANELNDPKSIGLLGMHERACLQGGELEIQGFPGKGTTVTVRLPLGS